MKKERGLMKSLTSKLGILGILVFVLIGLNVSTPRSSTGATYYVDGISGSDRGTGTENDPWKTINQALRHARHSDTIYIRYAVYNESINLAPIPLRGLSLIGIPKDGKRPVIHSASPKKNAIFLVNFTGVIKGLDITGATDAIGINCIANGGTNLAEISDCYIYGNSMGVHATTAGPKEANCSPMIHHNYIFANTTRGIGNMGQSTATIAYNVIYDNGSGKMGDGGIGVTNQAKPKIIGNLIFNNNDAGISMNGQSVPEIVNNTIYGHNGNTPISAGIRCGQDDSVTKVRIENNIIVSNARGIIAKRGRHMTGNDFNDIWNNTFNDYIGFQPGESDISADPLFADVENLDFHLLENSPCIDSANTTISPALDLDGIHRPQGQGSDMGAYEYHEMDAQELPAPHVELSVAGQSVTVTWNQVPEANHYKLFYAPTDIGYIAGMDLGQNTTYTTQLWPNAAFYVAVKACKDDLCSDYSNIARVVIK